MPRGRNVATEYLAMAARGSTPIIQTATATLLIGFGRLFREVQRRRQAFIHLSIEAGLFALGPGYAGNRHHSSSQSHPQQSTPRHS